MTDRLQLGRPVHEMRELNRAENSRAVFATPRCAAWFDNYQWGNSSKPFRRHRIESIQCR